MIIGDEVQNLIYIFLNLSNSGQKLVFHSVILKFAWSTTFSQFKSIMTEMITSTWVKCNQNHVHFLGIFCCQRRQIIIRRSDAIINTIDEWKCKYHVTFNLSLISFTLFNSSSVRSVYCFNKQFSRGFFFCTPIPIST